MSWNRRPRTATGWDLRSSILWPSPMLLRWRGARPPRTNGRDAPRPSRPSLHHVDVVPYPAARDELGHEGRAREGVAEDGDAGPIEDEQVAVAGEPRLVPRSCFRDERGVRGDVVGRTKRVECAGVLEQADAFELAAAADELVVNEDEDVVLHG